MRFIPLVLALMASLSLLHAKSVKTPADVAFMGVKHSIEIYRDANQGRLPGSWQELADGKYLSKESREAAERYLDFENRYLFTDIGPLEIQGRQERIRVMAKLSGGEGDNLDAPDPETRAGRLAIVETPDGSIETRIYPEKLLASSFGKAGLNLADYRGAAPARDGRTPEATGIGNLWMWCGIVAAAILAATFTALKARGKR